MIDTPQAWLHLCSRIEASPSIALDTEFISGKYPETILSVVQVGFRTKEAYLIDVLAFDDLSELKTILEHEGIVKIMHDPSQDLGLLSNASGAIPRNVFDVKLAARLLGIGENYSLSELAQTVCDVRLPKGQQRSNWLRRPLSSAQISYAKRDVLYLHQIRELLLSKAEKMKRTAWIKEEMRSFDNPCSYTPLSGAEQILSMPAVHALEPGQCAAITAIADWRKITSQATGIFPKQLLSNGEVFRLAKRKSIKPGAVRSACSSLPRRYETEVADLIAEALNTPPSECPVPLAPPPLTDVESTQLQLLQAVVAGHACKLGIQAELLGTTSSLTDFILNSRDSSSPLLNGWRWEIVGKDISDVLQGRASVDLHDGFLKVRPLPL